jgi:two-component system chemotaxis response regulator CheY
MAKRILTVDDSKTMRDMVSFTLRKAGFEVGEAEDGKVALTVLAGSKFDLIITDLNMPIMDGLTMIRELRKNPAQAGVPILFLTTESDAGIKAQAKAAGATGWLTKPFDPDQLIKIVQRILAK